MQTPAAAVLNPRRLVCVVVATLALGAPAARAQAAPPVLELPWPVTLPREAFERLGNRGYAPALFGLLDREPEAVDLGPMQSMVPDALGTLLTYVGEHEAALARDAALRDLLPQSADKPAPPFDGHAPRPAVAAVLELARDRRVVMLNEEHRSGRQRAFLHLLLEDLRAAGFTHLACETLKEGAALAARGYPTMDSGSYSRDPVYGDLLRRAVALGFELVRYEITPEQRAAGPASIDPIASANHREACQAQNLARVLDDPAARVVVFAGRHHIAEELGDWTPMAALFAQATDVDPLTVDLMVLEPRARPDLEHPARRAAVDAGLLRPADPQADDDAAAGGPIILLGPDGAPWSALPGVLDVTVFLPDARAIDGRPDWLRLGGLRRAVPLPQDLPAPEDPALLQALVAGEEQASTVPADQLVLRPGAPPRPLLLRDGRYHLRLLDSAGAVTWSGDLEVGDSARR